MSNRNGTVRTSLYLSDDWHEWLKEMARIRNVPLQAIIEQALLLWSERVKDECETKLEKLTREWAEHREKLDALEAERAAYFEAEKAKYEKKMDGDEDADAAHRAKIKGLKVSKTPDGEAAPNASAA